MLEEKGEKRREREREGEKGRKRKRKGEKGRKRKRKGEKRVSTNEIIRIKDSHGVKKASRTEFKLESLEFHTKNDNKNRKALDRKGFYLLSLMSRYCRVLLKAMVSLITTIQVVSNSIIRFTSTPVRKFEDTSSHVKDVLSARPVNKDYKFK